MNILITILFVIIGIIALLLLIALVTKKEYIVHRETTIHAPKQKVFDYIRHIKNQDHYSKWVMTDPNMKKDFKGTDGSVGFIYAWDGNKKAGQGEQEITRIAQDEIIETEVRFIRPFAGIANMHMATEPVSATHTKVKWNTASKIRFPMNIMILFVPAMLGKDMDISLANLKTILEKN